mmetsp:Transcript_24431/g.37881  ORF Transcript_24431/g.37881 Transcript_24431/m.37881 type:complete len:222 (-) Transcript_24431:23-688(-)
MLSRFVNRAAVKRISQVRNFSVLAQITKPAPSFNGMAYTEEQFKHITLNDYAGKYVVLFFYPLDFTFVCPTEIVDLNDFAPKFKDIGCEPIVCSVDSHFSHKEWTKVPRSEGGLGDMQIPMLSDLTKSISKEYGVLTPDGAISFRGTFIIDKNGILRHSAINDLPVGRNVEDIYRLVQAFNHADEFGEVCPASWSPGQRAMDPNHSSEKTQAYWKEIHDKK